MGRLIAIVVIAVAVVWLLKRALAGPKSAPPTGAAGEGALVTCAHCGVNLPKGEAYAASGVLPGAGGRFYCSEEHWRLGPRDG
jgi:hypothetical protein